MQEQTINPDPYYLYSALDMGQTAASYGIHGAATAGYYSLYGVGTAGYHALTGTASLASATYNFFIPAPEPTFVERNFNLLKDKVSILLDSPALEKIKKYANEYPQATAASCGLVGFFVGLKGLENISEGNTKLGLTELTLGILGISPTIYINREELIPLAQKMRPYADISWEWVSKNILAYPEIATITGIAGTGTLVLGINDFFQGNYKLAFLETVMGVSGISLGLYGLYGNEVPPCA